MSTSIKSGSSGDVAKVDNRNRLHVEAVQRSDQEEATRVGDSYNLNTGLMSLTSSGESGIMWMKNTGSEAISVTGIVVIQGPASGSSATDTTHIRMYKNVTTGTLVSVAAAAEVISNRNFGSGKTFPGSVYKGVQGATITDGAVHIASLVSPGSRVFFGIDEILNDGDSIAISLEPSDGNARMKCMCAIICHIEHGDA